MLSLELIAFSSVSCYLHEPTKSQTRSKLSEKTRKAPSLVAKTSFLLSLNKFERIKICQVTVC